MEGDKQYIGVASEYISENDILMHYGMKHRSGRYPWGSGKNPFQHSRDFLNRVEELKADKSFIYFDETTGETYKGETAIAKYLGLSTTELRVQESLAKAERRSEIVQQCKDLASKGYSPVEIGKMIGKNESSVRSYLNTGSEVRMNAAKATYDILKKECDEKGMILVGGGVEKELNVSREKLEQALYMLYRDGYEVWGGGVPQATNPGKQTNLRVLCPPGTEHKEIYNYDQLHTIKDYISHDGGDTFDPVFVYPKSMDSDRLEICYAEQGGVAKDGLMEIRRGVPDLDLGGSHYAQVRILVDNNRYLKGMAVYAEDGSLPDGVDIRFNTNKHEGTPKLDVLKKVKTDADGNIDKDNPFGSLIKSGINDPENGGNISGGQSYYIDKNGKKQLSLINKRAEEGDWGEWANKVPSQLLGKQPEKLVKRQLTLTMQDKQDEFDEIMSLTNPTIQKRLLKSFSDDCDAAAVHLKAAAFPRQSYQVIIPLKNIKDTEVYAPNYENGEKVALVRFPHGGTFEIPILTVNNKNQEGQTILGKNPKDAVGINSKVAERLSGADFDGDTVMVIPTGRGGININSTPELKGLKGFDNKMEYGTVEGKDGRYYNKNGQPIKIMGDTQKQMGVISNLITDMTIKGATPDKLARAVRHSMVVIDAEKHKLDYKQSEIDNGIKALKREYQGHYDDNGVYKEGASTLLSRAKSKVQIEKTKGSPIIDKSTGEVTYKKANETYVDKNGVTRKRMQDSTRMAETKDARTLSTGHPVEEYYASYANKMKYLANEARKAMVNAKEIKYNKDAKITYSKEVDSLNTKLEIAESNRPREQKAQIMANAVVKAKIASNPDMEKKEIKKESQRALAQSRAKVGAKRTLVEITDKEWQAIQAGAISPTKLSRILNNTDIDKLKERAMPRATTTLSEAKKSKIRSMAASGNYTNQQIAEAIGCSLTTVKEYID